MRQHDNPTGVVPIPARGELTDDERQQVMERFWQAVQSIGKRNRHLDPDFVMAVVTEVVEGVRQEQYEREQVVARNGH